MKINEIVGFKNSSIKVKITKVCEPHSFMGVYVESSIPADRVVDVLLAS
jgi:hypothetical protein